MDFMPALPEDLQSVASRAIVPTEKVYIQDEHYGWLPAVVLDRDDLDDRVKVRIELPRHWNDTTVTSKKDYGAYHKKVVWVHLNDYYNHYLPVPNHKVVGDFAELEHLHEAAMLYQIKERHAQRKPYTRVGEIVIAINPCEWIQELYCEENQKHYAKNFVWQAPEDESPPKRSEEKKDGTSSRLVTSSTSFANWYESLGHEPHIYEVSASAYRGLILDSKDQTIFVSGESGAGKTETVKIVLRHLATIDLAALSADVLSRSTEQLIRHIVESSPIFEAFGNAKTTQNHNSSRFGKVTKLYFQLQGNGMYSLEGGTSSTCLLETSRVVFHAPGERNFHIFYQLLALSKERKEELMGPEWADAVVADFRYLASTRAAGFHEPQDASEAEQTLRALEFFDWKGESLKTLVGALGILLRLGNLAFHETIEGRAEITNEKDLQKLSMAMGIEEEVIRNTITRKSLKTNQDELSVPVGAEYARDACDALAKRIYSCLFESIVRAVNGQTCCPKASEEYGIISLVDIFGFESFDNNYFEQLCINYASEKIQQKYVLDNFRRFEEEYEREGIELFDHKLFDNSDILELLEGPQGLLNSLNEECVKRNGSNEAFVSKVKHVYSFHKHLIDDKRQGKAEFGVVHFAGPVIYDASAFVERNSDRLPQTFLLLAMKSSNPLVAAELAEVLRLNEVDASCDVVRKTRTNMTVIDKFRSQLKDLLSSMNNSHTRYIRCIKPNEKMKPGRVDHKTIMRQLKCAGLVTAIELTREIFPNHLSFRVVEERYGPLLTLIQKENMKLMEPDERAQYMMSAMFSPFIEQYRSSDFTMPFACGKTRVYFRAGALELLETFRFEFFSEKATVIQRWGRSFVVKSKSNVVLQAIVKIQAHIRSFTKLHQFKRHKIAAITIQSVLRMQLGKMSAVRLSMAILHLKVACVVLGRAFLAKRRQRRATKIASWYRMTKDATRFKWILQGIVQVQSLHRARLTRDWYLIMKGAALFIQSWVRHAMLRQIDLYEQWERKSAVKIQSYWRMYQARNIFHVIKNKSERVQAAMVLQVWVRDCQTAGLHHRLQHMIREHDAATTIQSAVRAFQVRRCYRVSRRSALMSTRSPSSFETVPTSLFSSFAVDDTAPTASSAVDDTVPTSPCSVIHCPPPYNKDTMPSASPLLKRSSFNREMSTITHSSEIQLRNELEFYKAQVSKLQEDIQNIASETEFRAQDLEADYEEKLALYEDEVLQLKHEIIKLDEEKTQLKNSLSETERVHKKSIQHLQKGIDKSQASHRDYLNKVMSLLEETEESRKHETERIRQEMEALTHERDRKITALKEEIKMLRGLGASGKTVPTATTQKAQMIASKLFAALSPDNLLLVAKEAQRQTSGTPQKYIEKRLSSHARKMISYLEEMVSVAEVTAHDSSIKVHDAEQKVQTMQQKLVYAYESIEQLQGELGYEYIS